MLVKRFIITVILLSVIAAGTSAAQAAGLCVHPAGASKCFSSIQAAVDAANDGDRITIRPGKYVEQVTILEKNLTLVGQSGAIVEAPHEMQDTMSAVAGVEGRPIILVAGADVTLRGLVVDGRNSAAENPFLDGITFVSAGGEIRGNTVRNVGFGEPTLPIIDGMPLYMGNGIVVANQMATPRTIVISENRITKFNSVGITVFAETDPSNPAESTLTAHITDNVVVAQGSNDVIDQWGIFLGGYNFSDPQFSVTGTIRGNKVSEALTIAPHPLPGVGIATLFTHDVLIGDNSVENVNLGIVSNVSIAAAITHNQIQGPKMQGIGTMGLIFSGSDTFVSENRFKGLDVGLLLMVDDPAYGSALNTALDDNTFEKTAVDIMTGALTPVSAQAMRESTPTVRRFGPR
jgi:hypothetical protein